MISPGVAQRQADSNHKPDPNNKEYERQMLKTLTLEDKKARLTSWKGSQDDENRLFFEARNLAIEAICLRLELNLLRAGFNASVTWSESSFSGPSLKFSLKNPKETQIWEQYDGAGFYIKRDTVSGPSHLSKLVYHSAQFSIIEPVSTRTPKLIGSFVAHLKELLASGLIDAEVNKANYPFDRGTFSVF